MIERIEIERYRKLNKISIDLTNGINIISGTNGTCKSSILYMISNSFQDVKSNAVWLKTPDVISVLKNVNNGVNLKIESLTKGDDEYNDPASGFHGNLFTCRYESGIELGFRRHNTRIQSSKLDNKNRFSLKPPYKKSGDENLPSMPVIYLGLSRLYSFGEYKNNDFKKVNKKLPDEYASIVRALYKRFTGVTINSEEIQSMGDIKKRSKFLSDKTGIDSNTISAGEDNLLILLNALVSLRYYYENITSERNVESILLIDEVDATLHPAFQMKLLDLFKEYSEKYKIKLVCTTHSLSMLEYAFQLKCNVIYLLDNISSVIPMEDVDIYKIKMYLHNQAKEDIYINRSIPIFTEDEEARIFLNCLFEYYEREYGEKFKRVRSLFHFVEANISGDALVSIFKDDKLLRSTMRSICIIDGDKKSNQNLTNYTICLPGNESPEKLIFDYSRELYESDDSFWTDKTICDLGYVKINYRDNILVDIVSIEDKIKGLRENNQSVKGVLREENKKVFNKHKRFFELVMKKWVADHKMDVDCFYNNLHILFCKVSEFHDISSNEWER